MCDVVVVLLLVLNKTFSIYKSIFLFPQSSLTTQYHPYLLQLLATFFYGDSTSQYIMHVRDVALEDVVVPAFEVGKIESDDIIPTSLEHYFDVPHLNSLCPPSYHYSNCQEECEVEEFHLHSTLASTTSQELAAASDNVQSSHVTSEQSQ